MNKKAFTLIELLAVIVILGILLAIVIPKVNRVIDTSKKEAFKSTNAMIESEIRRVNGLEVTPRVYNFNNGVMSPNLEISGDLPTGGTIEISSDGKIQILTSSEDYCAVKRFEEDTIAIYDLGDTECNLTQEIALTINPNGGEYNGSTENITYQILPDGKIILDTPIKDDNIFAGWDVNCESCLIDDVYTVGNTSDTITATWQLQSDSYTYTGNSTLVDDGAGNWKLKFLTSGAFTPKVDMEVDVFLVGGGGGGYSDGSGNYDILGGGGGYTKTYRIIKLTANTDYNIVIGAGGAAVYNTTSNKGGTTSAFGYEALGGNGGGYVLSSGAVYGNGNGGSGGAKPYGVGGSDGSNGAKTDYFTYGLGQGTTTREFEDAAGDLYAGGGGNGMGDAGGAGGGGNGRYGGFGGAADPGTPNTGGGGGSTYGSAVAGNGGSGIVVIKKSLSATCVGSTNKYCFKYSGKFIVVDGDKDSWKIKMLTTGSLMPYSNLDIDAFLVGGGGGGMYNSTQCFESVGGGGGYTANLKLKTISAKTNYPIVIGNGGKFNYINQAFTGESTTAFGYTAVGGIGGGCQIGGQGGSGGGYRTGNGGSDGSDGGNSNGVYGLGQGYSTREFGDLTGDLYAGGGGGGYLTASTLGGAGGGGNKGTSGTTNTGGGGGSNSDNKLAGAGGSGIVVIRAAKEVIWTCVGDNTQYCFDYTGTFSLENETTDNWKIKFLTSGMFIANSSLTADAFLVGGGGGGASGAGGGGGGGYTNTQNDISLASRTLYSITVGAGGAKGTSDGNGFNGKSTLAFGYTASGGYGGNGWNGSPRDKGGNGGSGGGGGSNGSTGGAGGNNGANGITGATGTYGTGQGTTTREFGDPTGIIYGSGGGGGNNGVGSNGAGTGGNYGAATNATANTGGGGGGSGSGAAYNGGDGGSGIVIIRPS